MTKNLKKTSIAPIKFGQQLYAPFSIEVFDSRNTSFTAKETFSNERDATLFTKMKSVPFKAILHDANGNWKEYEKGTVTSWSVSQEGTTPMTTTDLELLAKCDGKHKTLDELFTCESCEVLFRD